MNALKLVLMVAGVLLLVAAAGIPLYELSMRIRSFLKKRKSEPDQSGPRLVEPALDPIPWKQPIALAFTACLPMLVASSIVVVPSGMGGVRVSQISGTLPGTLYPGVHFIPPLVESVKTFDLRDHLFTAGVTDEGSKDSKQKSGLDVQSREGLSIALAVHRALPSGPAPVGPCRRAPPAACR